MCPTSSRHLRSVGRFEYRNNRSSKSACDVNWAEVFVGFRRPPVADWGNIRWIHSVGAGVAAFLFRTGLSNDVLVTRTNEPFGPQIAEYCLTRALMFTQQLRAFEHSQAARRWEPRFIGTLAASRAVIVGTGEIGSEIARRFRVMGCRVEGVSRSGGANAAFDATHKMSNLTALAPSAQWLIVALPLTEQTFHLIDSAVLSACRGAVLVNVGAGQSSTRPRCARAGPGLPERRRAGRIRGRATTGRVAPLGGPARRDHAAQRGPNDDRGRRRRVPRMPA